MLFEVAMVVVVVVALAFFTAVPLNVAAKAAMWTHCVRHFALSKDTKRPKSEPPVVANPAKRGRRVRVVFVRHAESMWNSVFNVFGMGWPLRALRFFVGEAALFLTGPTASNIIDSPLSDAGRAQVEALSQMVRTSTGRIPSLQPSSESVIVCSNLRRAMQTAAGGLSSRIGATRERILIESDLQEGSRNPDASSFSLAPLEVPPGPVHGFEGQRDGAVNLALAFDPAHNQGDKKLSSSVFDRIDAFALRLVGEATAGQKGYFTPSGVAPSTVIAVGHSLYLMKFFQRFLPATSSHHSKTNKLHNCGVVEFDLYVDEQTGQIRIDETTISELYLGFNLKKKKTK